MPKLLGIDFGTKRIGLAITDDLQLIGSPWKTLTTPTFWAEISDIIAQEKIAAIVVGIAHYRDGKASETTLLQKEFIQKLNRKFPALSVHTMDERYTSKLASQSIHQLGLGKKKREDKSLVDKISAAIILQSYLDNR